MDAHRDSGQTWVWSGPLVSFELKPRRLILLTLVPKLATNPVAAQQVRTFEAKVGIVAFSNRYISRGGSW